jgi:hypothetical protein
MKLLLSAILLLCSFASAQVLDDSPNYSLDLARLKNYSAWRVSSNNAFAFSNDDSKRIMPGQTLVIADLIGPGAVTHMWMTVADNEFGWPRLLRLRVYYDGHKTPSVDAPLGDFFGVGHGYERNLNSMMVRDTSFGRARNSYWQMPFVKSCRITVTNEGNRFVTSLYYHVDYRKYASLPPDIAYFHAYYRQERPPWHGSNYEFLDIQGTGHYVGTAMSVVQTANGWFGEGDDLFYVDGEKKTRIDGTGTEDYFNDAWGLRVSDGAWTGTPVAEGEGVGARVTGYRWHVPDPIPFTKSLRAEIEHYGWTYNADGSARSGFEERNDFFSSVAFWYQRGVNEGLPESPYGAERLPLGNATQIEVENSINDVTTERGKASVQREVFWSKDLLFFQAAGPGARINVPFDVPEDGYYEVLAEIAEAPDYGDYVASLDGKLTNSLTKTWGQSDVPPPGTEIIHNYANEVYVAEDRRFGWFNLPKGRHVLTFVCAGKDMRSNGYNLGIDNVVLEKVPSLTAPAKATAVLGKAGVVLGASATSIVYRGEPLGFYLAELKSSASSQRPELIRALGNFGVDGQAAVPELAKTLADPDVGVRQAAAWSLSQVGPTAAKAVPRLIDVLADPDPHVRTLAAVALAAMGRQAEAAVPALIRALSDPVDYVRAPAADALGSLGPGARDAVQPLADRLLARGEPVFVLRSVSAALGDIGPDAKDALPALREALKMLRVTYTAQEAILKIEGRQVPTWR